MKLLSKEIYSNKELIFSKISSICKINPINQHFIHHYPNSFVDYHKFSYSKNIGDKEKLSQNNRDNNNDQRNKNKWNNFFSHKKTNILCLIGVSTFIYYYNNSQSSEENIYYNDIFKLIQESKIKTITIYKDSYNSGLFVVKISTNIQNNKNAKTKSSEKYKIYTLYISNIDKFIKDVEDKQIKMQINQEQFIPIQILPHMNSSSHNTSISTLVNVTSWSLFWYFLFKTFFNVKTSVHLVNLKDAANHVSFTSSKAREYIRGSKNTSHITLKDVAGLEQAKKEITEFIDFLKNPRKYHRLGAKIPHGALLVGPPGTGKTLLAKAIAGEANVPFFSISGSEFDEMYVGVGPARVRSLFSMAKERSPCIIFIDELDSVGAKRSGFFGQNDERRRTLNQLLVEMDGFNSNNKIIVLAATNRPDVLDNALLRPGRFDRKVEINLPDKKARESIFKLYLQKIKLNKDTQIDTFAKKLSKMTPGFAGADIANLVNEAAILSARQNKEYVDLSSFESASDRIIAGFEMKKILSPEEKKIVAYHEAGHCVINWYLPNSVPVYKISIIPRSKGSFGFNLNIPKSSCLYTKENMIDTITGALGGRLAEELFIGSVTTGAYDDLKKINSLSREMIMKYGMSDLGNVFFETKDNYSLIKPYSENMGMIIEKESKKIIDQCMERGKSILLEKKEEVSQLVKELLEKETLNYDEIKEILGEKAGNPDKERKLL